jgi:tRNA modification GTPase
VRPKLQNVSHQQPPDSTRPKSRVAPSPPPVELFAEELREAQDALASITGAFSADDLLGAIFGRFCIGK